MGSTYCWAKEGLAHQTRPSPRPPSTGSCPCAWGGVSCVPLPRTASPLPSLVDYGVPVGPDPARPNSCSVSHRIRSEATLRLLFQGGSSRCLDLCAFFSYARARLGDGGALARQGLGQIDPVPPLGGWSASRWRWERACWRYAAERRLGLRSPTTSLVALRLGGVVLAAEGAQVGRVEPGSALLERDDVVDLVDGRHAVSFETVLAKRMFVDIASADPSPRPVVPLGVRRSPSGGPFRASVSLVLSAEAVANRLSGAAADSTEAVEDRHCPPQFRSSRIGSSPKRRQHRRGQAVSE